MSEDSIPLTDDERRELEELRKQKRAREQEMANRRERLELERLRSEQARAELGNKDDAGAKSAIMEPGEDLSMPLAQKVVLAVVFLFVVGFAVAIALTHS